MAVDLERLLDQVMSSKTTPVRDDQGTPIHVRSDSGSPAQPRKRTEDGQGLDVSEVPRAVQLSERLQDIWLLDEAQADRISAHAWTSGALEDLSRLVDRLATSPV